MVDITVMIWYTATFRSTFQSEEDMNVYIDLIFAETNQGYINSQIPVSYEYLQGSIRKQLFDLLIVTHRKHFMVLEF